MPRIVGICLFKNEEYFLERALLNVAGFCDELILVDNASEDFSPLVAEAIAKKLPQVTALRVESPHRTHQLISHLAGTPTWVLGVDGDEIYDPAGLARLRPRILAGEFSEYFQLRGHSVHCTALDPVSFLTATGYATPAARPVTKLFNFEVLYAWTSPVQRLHGWEMVFREEISYHHARHFGDEQTWDESDLRLLHLCFLPRSRVDLREPAERARKNPTETKRNIDYKRSSYAVGDQRQVSITPFFPALSSLPQAPPDRVVEGYSQACRRALPDLRGNAHQELAQALEVRYPTQLRRYHMRHLGTKLARYQVDRTVFLRRPVVTVDIEPLGGDLPVLFEGQEALFVEVLLFLTSDVAEVSRPEVHVGRQVLQIPLDVLPAGQRSVLELSIDIKALAGAPGVAVIDLCVPRILRFRERLEDCLRVPLPPAEIAT
jgi:hypothetical protein